MSNDEIAALLLDYISSPSGQETLEQWHLESKDCAKWVRDLTEEGDQ